MTMTTAVLAVLVLCAVCVNSDDFGSYGSSRMPEYLRFKGAKYYSNPPPRIYRRPPIPQPVKGIFSYTPPPNYMDHDDPYPGNFKPKVSKRPTNNGLDDEDLNNIIKYLSKQDLDRIVEMAGKRYKEPSFEKYGTSLNKVPIDEPSDVHIYKSTLRELNGDQRFLLNGPPNYDMDYRDYSTPPVNYNPSKPMPEPDNFPVRGPLSNVHNGANGKPDYAQTSQWQLIQSSSNNPQEQNNMPLNAEDSISNNQFSLVDSFIQQEMSNMGSHKTVVTFTDSDTVREEQLPKPLNLREDQDYQLASSDNVPKAVKSSSYQVESFGDLPLMDYNSKRDSVSSYHVPHYTVISSSSHKSPPPPPSYNPPQSSSSSQLVSSPAAAAIKAPRVEPAPPVSAAKEQSDAHLKATKIWTHLSQGTAYTLHDDGTLSLEKPGRPKSVYGP